MEPFDYFLQIYGTLPRAGPGTNALTRRALELMTELPESPRILDVGCGPGMQTVELLRATSGTVLALDLLAEMIDRVRVNAEEAGVSDRLETLQLDMNEMSFPASSFDAIWSEGAIYFLGFEAGLRKLRPFVKPGGYVAVSEPVWLKSDPPPEVIDFWAEYPQIDVIPEKLTLIERAGYEQVGHFVMPPNAWTEHYYDPMETRVAEKEPNWRGIPTGEATLEEARKEISVFRRYSDYFSYAFFVMRKLD
jgi:ubiquinone/menaquinone biosynthesis C-methylase UbiE